MSTKNAKPVVEVYQDWNKATRTGFPLRWRWRVLDTDGTQLAKSRHSFRTEAKCRDNLARDALLPDKHEARTTYVPTHRRTA